jgi:hypothetical protein
MSFFTREANSGARSGSTKILLVFLRVWSAAFEKPILKLMQPPAAQLAAAICLFRTASDSPDYDLFLCGLCRKPSTQL